MGTVSNEHKRTPDRVTKVKNFTFAGIPQKIQAQLLGISEETLRKHYRHELNTAHAETVADLSNVAAFKAREGNEKMLALLLKTQGNRYGFVEKTVTETTDSAELEDLRKRTEQLEKKHEAEF